METPPNVTLKGKEYPPLADGKYDVIVCGTGLKECLLSGLLATNNKKVLVVDRNPYYGGESASLNLTHLFQKFKGTEPTEKDLKALGANRDYNVDIIPKFIMANGKLVKILVKTNVSHYLQFNKVDGCYVYKSGGNCGKVPATEKEAITTGLVGFFQKRKLRKFIIYVSKYEQDDPSTHEGFDCSKQTSAELFAKFGLDDNSQDFVGHAMALFFDETYKEKPALELVKAVRLYGTSLERYGSSPFIYPVYGLGGLPESFSRMCAVHGGVFMLNRDVDEFVYDDDGRVAGVIANGEAATANLVIGDPSYFVAKENEAKRVRKTGRVIRSICILDHPVKAVKGNASAQIIIPQKQIGRKNDIYVAITSSTHEVCAKGKYVAIVSTAVETGNPAQEIAPAIELLEPVLYRFDNVVDTYEPVDRAPKDKVFISSSYDPTSHFETTTSDVLRMYEEITGEPLNLNPATGGAGGGGGGAGGNENDK